MLREYLDNIRALLRTNEARWRLVVERQVLSQVLPKVNGTRVTLEPDLWDLLVFCLDGHEATAGTLSDEVFEQARQAAAEGKRLGGDDGAAFPGAAVEVAMVMLELREVGVYPPPRM